MSTAKPGSQTTLSKIRSPNYYRLYIPSLFFRGCALFYYLGKLVLLLKKYIQATLTAWGSLFFGKIIARQINRANILTVARAHVIAVFAVIMAKCMGDTSNQLSKMIVSGADMRKGRLVYDKPVGQSI